MGVEGQVFHFSEFVDECGFVEFLVVFGETLGLELFELLQSALESARQLESLFEADAAEAGKLAPRRGP